MAMIENIRKRRGLLIFFIGIGMLGFLVPYDAVMSLFGKTPGSETIGEINGKVINQGSFQKDLLAVQQSNLYRGDDNISSAAWTDLVNETLYAEDLDAAGYVVGDEEYEDVILGISPSAMVKQAYYGGVVNDETRAKAQELFETQPALSARAQKSMIVKRYKLEKLESLLKKGIYANSIDAERDYLLKNDKASVSFVSVKYSDLSDSTVTVSDSEVMSFFNRNKNNAKYQQRPFREVRYLEYDVFASPQDSTVLMSELAEFKAKFISSKDDSLYVIDHSDDRIYRKETYAAGTTAGVTDSLLNKGNVGDVVGPYEDGGVYKLAKIVEKKPVVSRVNGRHIFLKSGFQRVEKDSVLTLADSIKTLLEGGSSFSSLAAKWSADESNSSKGGSLGWLSPDDEIDPEEKVRNQLRSILVNAEKGAVRISEVPGGVSISEATNFEYDGENSILAVISRDIKASDSTQDELYSDVSSFALQYTSGEELMATAEEQGLSVIEKKITKTSRTVSGLTSSESIVRWINSRDVDLDEVSKIFDVDGKFVVATVSKIQDEKTPEFSTVEDDMRADALKEAKFKFVKSAMSEGNLDEIKDAVDGSTKKTSKLTFSSNNLNGLGNNEPEAVGLAFGSPADAITRVVKGDQGVAVIQVIDKTLAPEKASYSDDQALLQTSFGNLYNRIKSSLTTQMVKDERNR